MLAGQPALICQQRNAGWLYHKVRKKGRCIAIQTSVLLHGNINRCNMDHRASVLPKCQKETSQHRLPVHPTRLLAACLALLDQGGFKAQTGGLPLCVYNEKGLRKEDYKIAFHDHDTVCKAARPEATMQTADGR